jgi:subtilisin family serine protease
VYVFAAGNGNQAGERTDIDELISSRYTIAVGAIGANLVALITSETGASLFCCAPGSDFPMTARQINDCEPPYNPTYTCGLSGTSFASPHVGGVVALMQEANANLAWRDVMEAIVQTAATIDEYDAINNPNGKAYQTNQAGISHAYEYGHGLIDAYEAVSYVDPLINPAWEPLLYEREIVVPLDPNGMAVTPGQTKTLSVDAVANMRVEHVELEMSVTMAGVTGANVGPLEIEIERIWEPEIGEFGFGGGAHKTRSIFTVARTDPTPAYNGAIFTSVRHWGETGTAT